MLHFIIRLKKWMKNGKSCITSIKKNITNTKWCKLRPEPGTDLHCCHWLAPHSFTWSPLVLLRSRYNYVFSLPNSTLFIPLTGMIHHRIEGPILQNAKSWGIMHKSPQRDLTAKKKKNACMKAPRHPQIYFINADLCL